MKARTISLSATFLLGCFALGAGEFPRELSAYPGKTPKLDGVISPGEWDDATSFTNAGWIPQFSPTTDPKGSLAQRLC